MPFIVTTDHRPVRCSIALTSRSACEGPRKQLGVRVRHVAVGESFDDFRAVARGLLADHAKPSTVVFEGQDSAQLGLLGSAECRGEMAAVHPELVEGSGDLRSSPAREALAGAARAPGFVHEGRPTLRQARGERGPGAAPLVPKGFVALAEIVAVHRSPNRWALLYEALYRITHGEPHLLGDPTDALSLQLLRMKKSVTQDVHDAHAFVRFRKIERDGVEHYIAWYEPEHRCLHLAAPHFARRFASMRWSILTPDASASWDHVKLRYGPGVQRSEAPTDDALESLWSSYYASVFNPARLNVEAMTRQLPRRHWHNLPEAALIPELIRSAPRRTGGMLEPRAASPSHALATASTPAALSQAAAKCLLCPWAANATQTVFGEGPAHAKVMLIGEQPGDSEDLAGHPFIGPAGQVLMRVLAHVGLPREALYVTNAVKHFKFTPDDRGTGKKRLHEKPSYHDVKTCFGWLEGELRAVKPDIVVLLGATAGSALFGSTFRLVRSRGQFFETPWAKQVIATYHPSAVLRAGDPAGSAKIEHTCATI